MVQLILDRSFLTCLLVIASSLVDPQQRRPERAMRRHCLVATSRCCLQGCPASITHCLCPTPRAQEDVALTELLLGAGAEPDLEDLAGRTPTDYASASSTAMLWDLFEVLCSLLVASPPNKCTLNGVIAFNPVDSILPTLNSTMHARHGVVSGQAKLSSSTRGLSPRCLRLLHLRTQSGNTHQPSKQQHQVTHCCHKQNYMGSVNAIMFPVQANSVGQSRLDNSIVGHSLDPATID